MEELGNQTPALMMGSRGHKYTPSGQVRSILYTLGGHMVNNGRLPG